MRSLARETVFKYIFSQLFNPNDEELFTVLSNNERLTDSDKIFASELLNAVETNKEKYFSEIEDISSGYKLDRVFAADKCAILIGMAELDSFKTDIPIIIDEAVKLAVKFSTEKSSDFVNGILAEYSRRINK